MSTTNPVSQACHRSCKMYILYVAKLPIARRAYQACMRHCTRTRDTFGGAVFPKYGTDLDTCCQTKTEPMGVHDFEHVERSVSACIDHGERVDESAKKSIRTRTGRRMPTHREANTVLMSRKNLLVRFVRKDDDYLIIDVNFTGLSKSDMDTYAKAGVDAAFINGLDGIVATGLEA